MLSAHHWKHLLGTIKVLLQYFFNKTPQTSTRVNPGCRASTMLSTWRLRVHLIEGQLQLSRLLRPCQDQLSTGVVQVQVVHIHAHLYHVLHRLDAEGREERGDKKRKECIWASEKTDMLSFKFQQFNIVLPEFFSATFIISESLKSRPTIHPSIHLYSITTYPTLGLVGVLEPQLS